MLFWAEGAWVIREIRGYGQSPVCICLQKSQEHRVLVDRVGLGFREDKELVLWTADEVCVCGLGGVLSRRGPAFC